MSNIKLDLNYNIYEREREREEKSIFFLTKKKKKKQIVSFVALKKSGAKFEQRDEIQIREYCVTDVPLCVSNYIR